MKKGNQRVILTKLLFRNALMKLVNEKPLDKITISELCREASLNRATFYKYFSTPLDVLRDVEKELSLDLENIVSKISGSDNPKEALEEICTYMKNNSEVIKILIKTRTDDEFEGILAAFNQRLIALKPQLSELSDSDDADIALISAFYVSGAYHLVRKWLFDEIDKTPAEVANMIFNIINRAKLK